MEIVLTVVLAIVGTLTPFLLATIVWMRSVSAKLQTLHVDMVESSARQDVILGEHDRRIGALEIVVLTRND